MLESTDPATGEKTVLTTGELDSKVAEVSDKDGNRILREERYDNGTDPGVTIRQFDYKNGTTWIFNYDQDGNLYNSSYTGPSVSALLKPDGTLVVCSLDPQSDPDWAQLADSLPPEFGDAADHTVELNSGDQQLVINPDGSRVLTDFGSNRALHFDPGQDSPSKTTFADGENLAPTDHLYDAGRELGRDVVDIAMFVPDSMGNSMNAIRWALVTL